MFYREPCDTETNRPTYASVADAADLLGGNFKPHDVGQLVEDGEVEAIEHKGQTLVVVASLDAYAKGLAR